MTSNRVIAECPECGATFAADQYRTLGEWSAALDKHAREAGHMAPRRPREDIDQPDRRQA
jgi:hypothetical protein